MKRILLIEDNPEIAVFVSGVLGHHFIATAQTLKEAKNLLQGQNFSLILLDIELPDGDGINFYSELCKNPKHSNTPVVVITGKPQDSRKITAFELGVDDFLIKPLDPLELKLRCESKIKKAEKPGNDQDIKFEDLSLSTTQQKVIIESTNSKKPQSVNLTALEYRLLLCFVRTPNTVLSREHLLKEVWGDDTFVSDRTVDTHLSHLRRKLKESRVSFETLKGAGYRLTS